MMTSRPVTKDDVLIIGFAEVACWTCDNKIRRGIYDDVDFELCTVATDATSKGWKVIEGDMTCPDCVKAYRAEQSKAARPQGRGR